MLLFLIICLTCDTGWGTIRVIPQIRVINQAEF